MMMEDDKLKNGNAEYCINGPAICTPDNSDDWSTCGKSHKDGKVKSIEGCVTDDANGKSSTECVDPFDDILYYPDEGYTVECGPCYFLD